MKSLSSLPMVWTQGAPKCHLGLITARCSLEHPGMGGVMHFSFVFLVSPHFLPETFPVFVTSGYSVYRGTHEVFLKTHLGLPLCKLDSEKEQFPWKFMSHSESHPIPNLFFNVPLL